MMNNKVFLRYVSRQVITPAEGEGLFDKMGVQYEVTSKTVCGGSGVSASAGQCATIQDGIQLCK